MVTEDCGCDRFDATVCRRRVWAFAACACRCHVDPMTAAAAHARAQDVVMSQVAAVSKEDSDLAEVRARAERAEALNMELDARLEETVSRAAHAEERVRALEKVVIHWAKQAAIVDPGGALEAAQAELREAEAITCNLSAALSDISILETNWSMGPDENLQRARGIAADAIDVAVTVGAKEGEGVELQQAHARIAQLEAELAEERENARDRALERAEYADRD